MASPEFSVYNRLDCIGRAVEHKPGIWTAFTADDEPLGTYATRRRGFRGERAAPRTMISALREVDQSPELPANIEAEQALLGAILINNLAYTRVAGFLQVEHFSFAVHGRIYAAIGALIERGVAADPITLKNLFDQDAALATIGGAARYLARLSASAVTIVNAAHYGAAIVEAAQRRALIALCQQTIEAAHGDGLADDLVARHREQLDAEVSQATHVVKPNPFAWQEPATLPPREWLYGHHLIRGFASAKIAPGGTGKTALVVSEALAMVTGRTLLDDAPAGPLRVWLINLEDPIDELRRRVAAAALHYGLGASDIGDRLFLNSGRDTPLVVANATRNGVQIARPLMTGLRAEIAARQIDVLIVDPFVACHLVAENDNGQIAAVARLWADLAEATGCAIELVHHSRKSGPGQVLTTEDARGASALIAAVRSAQVLNPMSKEEGERAGIDNPRVYFNVVNGKANLAPPADKVTWRRLVGVALGNGDNVGVVEPWTWPDPFNEVGVDDAKEVQRRIAAGNWREDRRSKSWAGIVVAEVLGFDVAGKGAAAAVDGLLKEWLRTGALRVVVRKDEKRMDKRFIEVEQWLL